MNKLALIGAAMTFAAFATPASAATIVDLDGRINASLFGTNSKSLVLDAGTYALTFTSGAYTAFSRFEQSMGCNAAGASCAMGYENSVRYRVNGVTATLGDGAAFGGLGPQSTGGYFDTAARSLAHASIYSAQVTLAARDAIDFFIFDDLLTDNRGGVSVLVTPAAVPEPAVWALMILGFGAIGWQMRARRTSAAPAHA